MKGKSYYRLMLFFYVAVIYAVIPDTHLTFMQTPSSLYQHLTHSFLSGQLSLLVPPSQDLLHLSNPYDPLQNIDFRWHDASLFQGKYYLYFGPLPVLLLYLPLTWLTGFYPSDAFAVFLFLLLGITVNLLLLLKIKEKYFPKVSELQFILMGFLIAFANGTPVLLSLPRVYEVAIASAFCFMSIALFFLFRTLHQGYKPKDILLFSFFLSSTVACRPNFALICIVLISMMLIHIIRCTPKQSRLKSIFALLLPAMSIALLLGLYNYLRFSSIFDFGHYWQLSCNNIQIIYSDLSRLRNSPRNLVYGFYFYFFSPFSISSQIPYLGLHKHPCLYHIDTNYNLEAVAGILTTMPFILVLLTLPKLMAQGKKLKSSLMPFLQFTLTIPIVNTLFFMLMPFAIQRYTIDFVPYFVLISVITFWWLQEYSAQTIWFKRLRYFFAIAGCFSVLMGFSLYWVYWNLI